jgi:hypothetical protein
MDRGCVHNPIGSKIPAVSFDAFSLSIEPGKMEYPSPGSVYYTHFRKKSKSARKSNACGASPTHCDTGLFLV